MKKNLLFTSIMIGDVLLSGCGTEEETKTVQMKTGEVWHEVESIKEKAEVERNDKFADFITEYSTVEFNIWLIDSVISDSSLC